MRITIMSTKPISMNKLKSILQLKYSSGLSNRMIAKSLSISPATVSKYLKKATELGINIWPLPDDKLEEASLASQVKPKQVRKKHYPTPDWVKITEDLKLHKYLTLLITWEELKQENNGLYYSYNHFCRLYKYWTGTQRLSMRQTHHAGEKLFVDYCGPTIDIVSPTTGEVRTAQVFVAALGASNYTYCEATWSQKLEDWVMSHARCFEFLGGLPQVVIPDNLKSAVTRTCRYDPDLNPTYHQLATHYDIAIIPARPYKPKDKSKAEVAVQIVERWIMARLRKVTFHTLKALNQQIKQLLTEMNNKKMKQYDASRLELFNRLDKPALKPLPQQPYQYTLIKTVRVSIDYHVEIEKHYYSVPYQLVKKKLRAMVTNNQVSLFNDDKLVACHPRSYQLGRHTTITEHMPVKHQKQQDWSPMRFESWANDIGSSTASLIKTYLARREYPEQSYRVCLGLLSLSKKYGKERLEAACSRAIATKVTSLKSIRLMLNKGLDQQPLPQEQTDELANITHANIRGNTYYQH